MIKLSGEGAWVAGAQGGPRGARDPLLPQVGSVGAGWLGYPGVVGGGWAALGREGGGGGEGE